MLELTKKETGCPSADKREPVLEGLCRLLSRHADKRICVVGTTCTGKSTMLAGISGARDQDREIFPKLTPEESDYVCQVPWTEEIGRTMIRLVRERIACEAGRPVFGTVVLDCDLLVLLTISEKLLKERCQKRNVNFDDAKNMQEQLAGEVASSGIPSVTYEVA